VTPMEEYSQGTQDSEFKRRQLEVNIFQGYRWRH